VKKALAAPAPRAAANPSGRQQLIVATELTIATNEAETPVPCFMACPLAGFQHCPANHFRWWKADLLRSRRSPARGQAMKQGTGVSASLVAIVSSVATISCCLPLGFAAALGAGAASAFFTTLRPWLLGLSVVLLGLGFWQQHRAKQCAVRGRLLGNVLLWAAVVVVLGMILFPQQIAGFIADRFYETGK